MIANVIDCPLYKEFFHNIIELYFATSDDSMISLGGQLLSEGQL